MTFADIPVTPSQLYAGVGVVILMGGALLLFRKIFGDYATKEDLNRLETAIGLELERHSTARHEMRHEMTKLTASSIRVETILEQLPAKLRRE